MNGLLFDAVHPISPEDPMALLYKGFVEFGCTVRGGSINLNCFFLVGSIIPGLLYSASLSLSARGAVMR